jgi:hypothetical protein
MTQAYLKLSKTTDATGPDSHAVVSKPTSPDPQVHQSEEAENLAPTLDIVGPCNKAVFHCTLLYRDNGTDLSHLSPYSTGGARLWKAPWPVAHTAEEQKRMWHHSSLDMGEKQVADKWGFESTCVSRSRSPINAAEPAANC